MTTVSLTDFFRAVLRTSAEKFEILYKSRCKQMIKIDRDSGRRRLINTNLKISNSALAMSGLKRQCIINCVNCHLF